MNRRIAIAAIGILCALAGSVAIAGVATADGRGPTTTRPLLEPGTTMTTDERQTHGSITLIRPRPTYVPPPEPVPLTVPPNYTG